jgi:hypothetical protein
MREKLETVGRWQNGNSLLMKNQEAVEENPR